MLITLENTSKRYNYEWIFRNLSFSFTSGNAYAILGPNGSGKSTLMQCISGFQSFSEGKTNYTINNKAVERDRIFNYVTIAAPYLELIEEMSLKEIIHFQQSFKPFMKGKTAGDIIDILKLGKHSGKHIKLFSSGMKQRVKLALAVLSEAPVVLLDEPTTNLDNEGVNWYLNLVNEHTADKLLIVCSNIEREYSFCKERITMSDYKL